MLFTGGFHGTDKAGSHSPGLECFVDDYFLQLR
jgi:hypothetical protein